jgi:TRAP-type mannitol/chloroaromatic compound transport system substrate-binding protein
MVGSYHQQGEFLELLIHKPKWDALPADLQAIVRYAAMAESSDFTWRMLDRNSKDLQEMKDRRGVTVVRTPDSILQAQLTAWDGIVQREVGDPFFKKVIDSQRAWAERTVKLRQEIPTDTANSMAARHWWKS